MALLIRILISFLLLTSSAYAQQMPPLGIQDEGGAISRPVNTVNCVGGGINCSFSVNKGTLTVSGGAATDTDSVVTLEVNNTVEQTGTFTVDFDGTYFQSTESPTDEENISIKDIYVLNTSDVMSGTIAASNLSGTNTGDQTSIVGITGTKAQFDTSVSDGNFLYVGDVTTFTDEAAQDAVGSVVGNGLDYDDPSGAVSVDETELTHNSLGSKQGGTSGEYYHITSAQNTVVGNTSGTNTGDQTSIVGITGTKAQFDTAVTDGNILYVGDVSNYTDEQAQDATGAMAGTSLVYVDGTPLLARAALTGDVTASQDSNAMTIANDAVSLAKMANMATASILGRNTAATGDPEVLSASTTKTLLSLNNVDNTTDANKPVSSATQTALNLKSNLASPTFTGTVTMPTPFTLGAVSVLPTGTELNYVDGVTSNIQTQLDDKLTLTPATTTRNLVISQTATTVGIAIRPHASQSVPNFLIQNTAGNTTAHFKTGGQLQINLAGTPVVSDDTYVLSLQNTGSQYSWLEILNNGGTNKGAFFGLDGNEFQQYSWQGGGWGIWTSTSASDGNLRIYASNDGNVGLVGSGKWAWSNGWGGGVGVVVLGDAVTPPTTSITTGLAMYSVSGELYYMAPSNSAKKVATTDLFASGTYTPTRSAETNLDSNVTMTQAQYMRVGSTVNVSGKFTADPTTTTLTTSFEITLPVASNVGATDDVAGTAFCGNIVAQGAAIEGVVANDTMKIFWKAADVTSQSWSFTATYQVI